MFGRSREGIGRALGRGRGGAKNRKRGVEKGSLIGIGGLRNIGALKKSVRAVFLLFNY